MSKEWTHTHIDENGNEYTHTHVTEEKETRIGEGTETHTHTHSHEGDHSHTREGGHAHTHEGGYSHTHEGGHVHTHEAGHAHTHEGEHSHTHDPKAMRAIVNRLSRSIGHLESVKRMIEDGQDCADVLVQLAAVRSEINNAGKALLKEHLDHCIVDAVAQNDQKSIEKMNAAIDRFMK